MLDASILSLNPEVQLDETEAAEEGGRARMTGPLELGPRERNRFLTAVIRQSLLMLTPEVRKYLAWLVRNAKALGLNKQLRKRFIDLHSRPGPDDPPQPLTADDRRVLNKLIEQGWLDLDLVLDLRRELSPEELREFAGKVTGGRSYEGYDSEDFIQDTLCKMLASPPDFLLPESGQDASAWVRTVTYNHRRHAIRDEGRHQRITRKAALQPHGSWVSGGNSRDLCRSAEDIALQHMAEEDITKRIFRLPKRLADVAWLRWIGCEYAEIAQELGIPTGTVSRRLHDIKAPRVRLALELPRAA